MNFLGHFSAWGSRPTRARGWAILVVCGVLSAMTAALQAASIQITAATTNITGTRDVVSNLVFEHDLVPTAPGAATQITVRTVVAGFTVSPTPKLANVIKLLEDGAVVAVISAPTADDFANNSTNEISYTPSTPGLKTLVVQATNGEDTVSSTAIRANVYGIAIGSPANDTSAPGGSDLFVSGSALLRSGVIATVQFFVDGTPIGTDANAPYAVAWRPTAVGPHTLQARATVGDGSTFDSPTITFSVVQSVANGTLSVSLLSPTSGATVAAGTAVTVSADARLSNASGSISQVQFYANGIALGDAVTSFPYTTTWSPAVAGAYVITAIATDDKGNARASAGAVVTVTGNVPAVTLTNPADNAVIVAGSGVSLTALPTGQDGSAGTVSSVEFFVDGNSVGAASAVPYSVVWTPLQARTTPYTITARVTASNGAQASSAPASVTVVGATAGPSISLSTSYGTAPVPAGKTVTLTALAADQTGSAATVAQVDFFVEGTLIATVTTSPFTATWTPLVARDAPYSLQARVTLRSGLAAFSAPVLVQVVANAAPTVTISAPIDGQTFTLGSPITLSAIAGDSDGTIARVQFFANNAAVGSAVTTAPFQTTFTPTVAGSYTIWGRAVDDAGNATASGAVRITVKVPVGVAPSAFINILPESSSLVLEKIFTAGSSIVVGVGASDADGTIARVALYLDGTRLGTFEREPYVTTVQLPSSADLISEHTFSAIIEDNDGNQANAAETVAVISSSRSLPTLKLVTPVEGAVYNYGTAITAEAQLVNTAVTANAVVFEENGSIVQTVSAAPYKITYVPGSAGPKALTAIAYYNWTYTTGSGATRVDFAITTSATKTVNYTVKEFSPTTDTESFVSQTYLDLLQRAATTTEVSTGTSAIGGGSLTRAQLAANLVGSTGFADCSSALAAAWIITGKWPGYDSFVSTLATIRGGGGLAAACGELLASNDYVSAYGPTPTAASLTGTNSYTNLQAFATQLYQNAFGRNPSLAEIQAVANAPSSATQAGGISVVGLNQFLAEFVTKNSAGLVGNVRAAGLYLGLLHQQPGAAEVAALAAKTLVSAAGDLLAEALYALRFLSISHQPQNLMLAPGTSGLLQVEVSGTGPFGYQWYRNGALVPGGTRSTLALNNVTASTAGSYYVVVTSTTSRVVSSAATVTVAAGSSRLVNLSSRAYAGAGDDSLIAGFVLAGSGNKRLLLRGVGPGLAANGVSGALSDPRLVLTTVNGSQLAANDDWGAGEVGAIESAATSVGAFTLARGSRDAVVLSDRASGVYSVLASNASGAPGVGMVEIYDAGAAGDGATLMNLSSRARVGTGEQVMIAGFVIGGNVSKRVLIRAVGPGLVAYGVAGALIDPQLTLTAGGAVIATNDNWSASADAALLGTTAARVGAFPLDGGSLDAAVIVSLPPGVYSAVVSGVSGTTGIALVEVYDADP